MNKIVLNIPFSNPTLPDFFLENALIEKDLIDMFNMYSTETHIDRIFGKNNFPKIIAPYSKIVCNILNIEHFRNPSNFDFIPTKTNKNRILIKPTKEYLNKITNEYYKPLHNRIEQTLTKETAKGPTIFINCHSHPSFLSSLNEETVEVIISTHSKYSKAKQVNYIKKYFEKLNYKVAIDDNDDNCFVPYQFLQEDNKNLCCIALSLNQNLFLSLGEPNKNFKNVQKNIQDFLKDLKIANF